MTDAQWLSCTEPLTLLDYLRTSNEADDRKFRLFACACCRRIWDRLPDPRNRDLVAIVEDHPEGNFHDPELEAAIVASSAREWEVGKEPAYWVAKYLGRGFYKMTAAVSAVVVACKVMFLGASEYDREAEVELQVALHDAIHFNRFRLPKGWPAAVKAEAEIHAALVRDIFGSPFRPASTIGRAALAWNERIVVRLAQSAYEDRHVPDGTFYSDRLAVLADALEEAGVTDAVLLDHLRGPGPHVRGCFALDAILGRT